MDLGFGSLKDVLEVLLVPVSLGLLAVGWPAMSERRRRLNFESLIRRELEEAAPRDPRSTDSPWHAHLTRRFLHEEIIRSAVDNADFVLSLAPELSYHVSQMWIEYSKAQEESRSGQEPTREHATQFSWHLEATSKYLDRGGKSTLCQQVWKPWDAIIKARFPK